MRRAIASSLISVVLALVVLAFVADAPARAQAVVPATTIVITLDGFRADYLDRLPAPSLMRLAREGVRATGMRPGFPSYTFPAHHTLATGLFPEQHGVIANTIAGPHGGEPLTMNSETPSWWTWTGEPFWITAERQSVKAATLFWPAASAEINGYRPTYRRVYDSRIPYDERVAQVLQWLDLPPSERPRVLTMYMEAVDHAGHEFGPFSDELRDAVARVDEAIGQLLRGLEARGLYDTVNVIVTADHGMSEVSSARRVFLTDIVPAQTMATVGAGPYMYVTAVDGDVQRLLRRLKAVPHVRAYARGKTPGYLHYRNPPQAFDVLLLADEGWRVVRDKVSDSGTAAEKLVSGAHGYDVRYPSMKALFVAHGPAFKRGVRLREFDSVNVYALIVHLLGLEPAPNSGRLAVFGDVLTAKPGHEGPGLLPRP